MADIFMSFAHPGQNNYSGNIGSVHHGVLLSLWRNGTHHETDEQKIYIPTENIRQVIRALSRAPKGEQ